MLTAKWGEQVLVKFSMVLNNYSAILKWAWGDCPMPRCVALSGLKYLEKQSKGSRQVGRLFNSSSLTQMNLKALKGRHIPAWGIALCPLNNFNFNFNSNFDFN